MSYRTDLQHRRTHTTTDNNNSSKSSKDKNNDKHNTSTINPEGIFTISTHRNFLFPQRNEDIFIEIIERW